MQSFFYKELIYLTFIWLKFYRSLSVIKRSQLIQGLLWSSHKEWTTTKWPKQLPPDSALILIFSNFLRDTRKYYFEKIYINCIGLMYGCCYLRCLYLKRLGIIHHFPNLRCPWYFLDVEKMMHFFELIYLKSSQGNGVLDNNKCTFQFIYDL